MSTGDLQFGCMVKKSCLRKTLRMATQRRKHFIREWIDASGFTEGYVAIESGMSTSNMSFILNGSQNYTQETLENIAAVINRKIRCEPYDLISRPPNNRKATKAIIDRLLEEISNEVPNTVD